MGPDKFDLDDRALDPDKTDLDDRMVFQSWATRVSQVIAETPNLIGTDDWELLSTLKLHLDEYDDPRRFGWEQLAAKLGLNRGRVARRLQLLVRLIARLAGLEPHDLQGVGGLALATVLLNGGSGSPASTAVAVVSPASTTTAAVAVRAGAGGGELRGT